jgi:hypothetical protein
VGDGEFSRGEEFSPCDGTFVDILISGGECVDMGGKCVSGGGKKGSGEDEESKKIESTKRSRV